MKEKSKFPSHYKQSYFEGYILLTYTMMYLACVKYEELLEDIEGLCTKDQSKKGKGSLELKIDRKVQEWRDSYLLNIRTVLQKYSRELEILSDQAKVDKIDLLLKGIKCVS